MLVCDQAIREERTGKVSLIGIFENITTALVPTTHSSLSVYVKLTDAEGQYDLELKLVHLDTASLIARGQGQVTAQDRMGSVEINFNLLNLIFPHFGSYEFQLSANGRHLGSKTLSVVRSASSGGR